MLQAPYLKLIDFIYDFILFSKKCDNRELVPLAKHHFKVGRDGKSLVATSAMVGRICPPGGDRVKVSENLAATAVAPRAPVDTSLVGISDYSKQIISKKINFYSPIIDI